MQLGLNTDHVEETPAAEPPMLQPLKDAIEKIVNKYDIIFWNLKLDQIKYQDSHAQLIK